MVEVEKAQWGRHIEFILTLVGFAVGLGNVWRFPYLCYSNGGGAFLIPYFISLLFIGVPIFFMEVAFGQFSGLGPVTIWRINPTMKGLGAAMVVVNSFIGMYYSVVIAYALFFFFSSMTSDLPWANCNNDWNTCACNRKNDTILDPWNGTKPECVPDFGGNETLVLDYYENLPATTPSQEFFYRRVLDMTSGVEEAGGLKWDITLCNLLAWCVVFMVLIKGVQSLGKVVYFAATFPYVLLTVLLVRGLTLDGYYDGIVYYLKPDIERLSDATVWSQAAVQIFYSLSACSGGLIAMASYNKFTNNCFRDAMIVPLINCATSFYAGFVIFSVLGFMAHEKGVSVANVTASGPGLAFVVYPEALAVMPVPPLWSILFFLMLITLGFSSQFSIVESTCTAIIDEFPALGTGKRRIATRFCICITGFLLGMPMTTRGGQYMLNLVDTSVGGLPLLFVGFFELIAVNWIYGFRKFSDDVQMMLGRRPFIFFTICWLFISPLALLALIGFSFYDYKPLTLDDYVYPDWANALGWLIVCTPLVCIPAGWVYYICKNGGYELTKRLCQPLPTWKPNDEKFLIGRYADSRVIPEKDITVVNGLNTEPAQKMKGYNNDAFITDTHNDREQTTDLAFGYPHLNEANTKF